MQISITATHANVPEILDALRPMSDGDFQINVHDGDPEYRTIDLNFEEGRDLTPSEAVRLVLAGKDIVARTY